MLHLYWESMPSLTVLADRLRPWGSVAMTGKQTLRFIPTNLRFPPTYVNQNGSIDVMISGLDLFEQEDCVERLQQWLGIS